MKYLIPLFALFLIGCRTPQQLIDKAIRKDSTVLGRFNDTIKIPTIHLDTIWFNDTFEVIKSVRYTDTVISVQYIHAKGRFDYKRERDDLRHELQLQRISLRKYKDSLTTVRKMHKTDARVKRVQLRQENKRSNWWVWLLIGSGLTIILRLVWKNKPFVLPL
jgi:hypothetical protein